ncbi:MAG: winged helix-turn-helix transcriptional regulator, partial [Candidatus Hodarchaeales archaeon]
MDLIDKNILLNLVVNCRRSYQEMAHKNGISANGIKKRINKMISLGLIENFYTELSLAMVDAEMSLSLIYTDGTEDEQAFLDQLGNDPRVNTVGQASGGVWIVFAIYTNGSVGLSELGTFFRIFPFVKNIELHPLLYFQGKKINKFSMSELTVLKYLIEDARMTISEISRRSGITSRMVSSVIKEFQEN